MKEDSRRSIRNPCRQPSHNSRACEPAACVGPREISASSTTQQVPICQGRQADSAQPNPKPTPILFVVASPMALAPGHSSGFRLVFSGSVRPPFPLLEQATLRVTRRLWPHCSRPTPPIQRHTSVAVIKPNLERGDRVHGEKRACSRTWGDVGRPLVVMSGIN